MIESISYEHSQLYLLLGYMKKRLKNFTILCLAALMCLGIFTLTQSLMKSFNIQIQAQEEGDDNQDDQDEQESNQEEEAGQDSQTDETDQDLNQDEGRNIDEDSDTEMDQNDNDDVFEPQSLSDFDLEEMLDVSSDEDEEATPASRLVMQKERLHAEIEDLKRQLLGQLAQYQQLERRYHISLDQYERLQTLQSIENAVAAAQQAMLSRSQILNTYLSLLRLQLIEAEGIELTHKNRALELIEDDLADLERLTQELDRELDREELNEAADDFEPLGERILETSYYSLNLLSLGRLQSVYDQAYIIHQKIKEKDTADENFIQRTQRQRALNEVDKLIDQILAQFRELWPDLDPSKYRHTKNHYQRMYRRITGDLNLIYTKLAQLVSYLEELEGLK